MDEPQIFISYRRDGGSYLAPWLCGKLKERGFDAFYDRKSMHAGRFDDQILVAITQSQDVLVLLSPNALDRCDNPEDWVRKEIEAAIALNKNIIPIMMDSFKFPADLPPSINPLRYYHGVEVTGASFEERLDYICSMLLSKPQAKYESLSKGILFLKAKQYKQAVACLENAALEELSNPEVYFYTAVALLEGKRPFLQPKKVIDRVLEQLETACDMQQEALYHYFLAYVKFDYHHRKVLRAVPDFMQELDKARSLGLDAAQGDALFALLRVDKPDLF